MISSLSSVAEIGDNIAIDALFSVLYFELHRLAKRELRRRWSPEGLSVTTLLHEPYLDMAARPLVSRPRAFYGYAAVDTYFGRKAPEGKDSNWAPTDPDRKFEVMFRLYGPTKALFDKTWVLPDIEKLT